MTATLPPLDATVARFERPLVRYATRIVGDPELARDVVQDTFLRLWEAEGVDPEDDRIEAWLYRVCRNRAIDLRRRRRPTEPLDDAVAAVAPRAEAARAVAEVGRVVADMPPRKGEVFALRYLEGESYQQISERTGLSVSHVGVVLHKAVRRVRDELAVVTLAVLVIAGAWWATEPAPLVLSPQLRQQHLTVPVDRLLRAPEPPPRPAPLPPPVVERHDEVVPKPRVPKPGVPAPRPRRRGRPAAF